MSIPISAHYKKLENVQILFPIVSEVTKRDLRGYREMPAGGIFVNSDDKTFYLL